MTGPDNPPATPTRLEHEAYGWVVRFISGEAGPDDIEALKAWSAQSPAHAAAFDEASKVWQAAAPLRRRQPAVAKPDTFRAVERSYPSGRSHLGRRAFLGGALAASAAGAAAMAVHPPLGLWPSWSEFAADYRTGIGERRQIVLAGHVSIDMNTRTSVALRPAGGEVGQVELIAGEAMISALPKASGSFAVFAGDGRAIAADARFNIRRDGGSVCVTCMQGQVRVEAGPMALPLSAGQQVVYAGSDIGTAIQVDSAVVAAWQDGIVIFDATPVAQVIEEVNRYRPGRVILTSAALGRERFSARFRIASIDGVVGQLEQVFHARATTLPGGIVLLG
ncbi:sigma factor regulator VreR [Aliidongia dinghuensis]|uniref:Sigma factor regulator VreR n=1 Tax=Aliidongia dinghuensis TaxID=1867774 RepID=A0A8J2YWK7_9PROT|nr:FecR domain-containing protein [Aliidongia dinghuensis]GGF32208.1 sigma factor regulator VreR [Aliidongia dinghuensis]